ncbi:hypothetical protein DFH09DRAFT_1096800 [Mycena vulgaris]|nr:hypothetical protein DFH09DRAFT_1096800 [Mycena vulgaris]
MIIRNRIESAMNEYLSQRILGLGGGIRAGNRVAECELYTAGGLKYGEMGGHTELYLDRMYDPRRRLSIGWSSGTEISRLGRTTRYKSASPHSVKFVHKARKR